MFVESTPRPRLSPFAETCGHWLARMSPVSTIHEELGAAIGAVIAEPARARDAVPPVDVAARDGWALNSADLVSASAFAPAMPSSRPLFLALGEVIPAARDCVVEDKFVSIDGRLSEVRVSAAPGEGVLRKGDDVASGARLFRAGQAVDKTVCAVAKAAGLTHLTIRRPSVVLIDVSDDQEVGLTTPMLASIVDKAGGRTIVDRSGRDVESLSKCLSGARADLIVTIGATGNGHGDIAAKAIADAGTLDAHGLAVDPGASTALGSVAETPVLAVPGSMPDAFAIALTVLLPAMRRLMATPEPVAARSYALKRKITSRIGFAELALMNSDGADAEPLTIGRPSLSTLTQFDIWALIGASSEGVAAGGTIEALSWGGRM